VSKNHDTTGHSTRSLDNRLAGSFLDRVQVGKDVGAVTGLLAEYGT
jgi:hypothetical protein